MAFYISDGNSTLTKFAGSKSVANRAMVDASNLSSANVTSWKNALGCKKVTLLYDMNSNDSGLNWGYTTGIYGNLTVSKDLTAYKSLILYFCCYYSSSSNHGVTSQATILDLSNQHGTGNVCYGGMVTPYYSGSGFSQNMGILPSYNLNDKSLFISFFYGSNSQGGNPAPNGYYCYKIEGIE